MGVQQMEGKCKFKKEKPDKKGIKLQLQRTATQEACAS
jgi:hypothetical protein